MHAAVDICFRNMIRSSVLIKDIEEKARNLEDHFDQICRCQVVVEAPHWRKPQGNLYRVSVLVSVPSRVLAVGRDAGDDYSHENPFFALERAFNTIRQKLEAYVLEFGDELKLNPACPHGQITKICLSDGSDRPESGYGVISTCDGREVFFHPHNLQGMNFQQLEVGSEVDFVEENDDDGSHASAVRVVGHNPHFVSG